MGVHPSYSLDICEYLMAVEVAAYRAGSLSSPPQGRTELSIPTYTYYEMECAIRDCAEQIRNGNDPNQVWLVTLEAHAISMLQDAVYLRDAVAALTAPQGRGDVSVEVLAKVAHDAYELEALVAGWETNERSRVLWPDVPEANKRCTRAAVSAVLAALRPAPSSPETSDAE
jgi:hypothetical protein